MTPTEFGKMMATLAQTMFWMMFLAMMMMAEVIQRWTEEEAVPLKSLAKSKKRVWEFMHEEKKEAMDEEKGWKF